MFTISYGSRGSAYSIFSWWKRIQRNRKSTNDNKRYKKEQFYMITIKRSLLIFIVVVALVAGAFGVVMYMGIDFSNLPNLSGEDGNVTISKEDYKDYQYLMYTYVTVYSLRSYIVENY